MGLIINNQLLNHMRTSLELISLSLLTGLTILGACKATATLPADRVQLTVNQLARLASGVAVQVDAIQDSRCPEGVQCIIAGWASVKATVSKAPEEAHVVLTLGAKPKSSTPADVVDSTGVVLAGTTYKVILRDVTPYPKIGSSEPKQALIQVTQL